MLIVTQLVTRALSLGSLDVRIRRRPGRCRLAHMSSGPGREPDGPGDGRYKYFYAHLHVVGGWMACLPLRAISIVMALAADGPLTADGLDARWSARDETPRGLGLAAAAWEPLEEFADAEWRRWTESFDAAMRQHCPQLVPGGEWGTAGQGNEGAWQEQADRIARMDADSAALGVAPVRTMADLLEFMVACTVVTAAGEHNQTRYVLNPQALPPAEVLPRSGDGQPASDQACGWRQHELPAQDTIGLLTPGDTGRADILRANLRALAHVLDLGTEANARSMLLYWLSFDWNPSIPVELADPHRGG